MIPSFGLPGFGYNKKVTELIGCSGLFSPDKQGSHRKDPVILSVSQEGLENTLDILIIGEMFDILFKLGGMQDVCIAVKESEPDVFPVFNPDHGRFV